MMHRLFRQAVFFYRRQFFVSRFLLAHRDSDGIIVMG